MTIAENELFESHLAGLFIRLWSIREGAAENPAVILNNSQNVFDEWFGDICGEVEYRYFIIELKRERNGFIEEIDPKYGKAHRYNLYEHLRNNSCCRDISIFGHFAGYEDKSKNMAFEPYAHSIAPELGKVAIMFSVLFDDKNKNPLDYRRWTLSFDKLYDALHENDMAKMPTLESRYNKGLGITLDDLEKYIDCMYSHLDYEIDNTGIMLLGAVNPVTGEFKSVTKTPFQMTRELKEKFNTMRTMQNNHIRLDDDFHP